MPIILAANSGCRPRESYQGGDNLSYWSLVWRDYVSIAVVAAGSLWVYLLPMYLLDRRIVHVSQLRPSGSTEDQLPIYSGPPELSYPWIKEPIPTWACGIVVVLVPMLVVTLFQLKLRSLWDFHAGLTGTLRANVASTAIATILKHFIGGFRPHYIQVCKPDLSLILEGTGLSQGSFSPSACTADSLDVNRAIQGFPSGHTTSAFSAAMFLTLYLNAKLKAFADQASEFWVFIVTILPLLLASLIGGSMYITHQHHAHEVIIGMIIGMAVGTLGYRSAYAAVFDARYNHIPLPPFGARVRFAYDQAPEVINTFGITSGDISGELHPVMWSWWTRSGANIQEQHRGLMWLRSMRCVRKVVVERVPIDSKYPEVGRVD